MSDLFPAEVLKALEPSEPDPPPPPEPTDPDEDAMKSVISQFAKTGKIPQTAMGLVLFYNMMLSERGFTFPDHLFPVARALMDDRIKKMMVTIGPGSGKSQLLSVVYPAFRLGCDPTLTVLGISAGEALMQGFQRAVGEWIESSPMWSRLFPTVRPDKDSGWSTERGLFVTGRAAGDPDASYFAAGLTSSKLTGVHARLILIDDIHNRENAASVQQCEGVRAAYYNTILGRADPRGARFIMAGRRWHEEDIYGHLQEGGDWVTMALPAERLGSTHLYWDVTIPDGLECCFNDGSDW